VKRILNDEGVRQFSRFIEELRSGLNQNTPLGLLTARATSVPFEHDSLDIQARDFETRYQLGEYLVKELSVVDENLVIGNRNFWSSLALVWFDRLCPPNQDGTRKPSMAYNYVLSENYQHRPRHAIYTTWELVRRYAEDAKFLLNRPLPVRGELVEQLMARQYFLSCDSVIRAASAIYYDPEKGTFKRGAAARKSPGCVQRYVDFLQQIEVTYDLFSIPKAELLSLMPDEFSRFMQG